MWDIYDGYGYYGVDERNSKSVYMFKWFRSEFYDSLWFKVFLVNRLCDEYYNGKLMGVFVFIESNDFSVRLFDDLLMISDWYW